MAMNATVFRHTGCDDLGSLASLLDKVGIKYQYINSYFDDLSGFNAFAPDLLIVLGGAPGVYQDNIYPFIKHEIDILEKRMAKNLPVLGICLGAQIMAKALGANVYPGQNGPEKGWYNLSVDDRGMKTPVRHLDKEHTKMLQWHGDTFDLPDEAVLLASSESYKNQIFSYGKNCLALQCHAEVTPEILSGWMVSAAGQVAEGKLDIQKVRTDTENYINKLMQQTERFFLEWLQQIRRG